MPNIARFHYLLAVCIFVASCDGPHEDAGERIDAPRGETGGTGSIIVGRAEKRGEQIDRVSENDRNAVPTDTDS